jgi:hypothetical protein
MATQENPALVVEHGSHELKQVRGGGGGRKRFATVNSTLREKVAGQWHSAAHASLTSARRYEFLAGVVKVKLRPNAIAKSHRPQYLLQQAGRARIIGASHIGTLLVAVSPQSEGVTRDAILQNSTENGEADLTTIESIEPYAPADVTRTPLTDTAAYELGAVLTLFDFRDPALNAAAAATIRTLLEQGRCVVKERMPGRYLLNNVEPQLLHQVAAHPAVRRIWPNAQVALPAAPIQAAAQMQIPPPANGNRYPVVGVLDSGVSPTVTALTPWVTTGPTFPPDPTDEADYSHGTFIAGLIAGCHTLNAAVAPLPEGPCRIFSSRVFSPREPIGIEDLVSRIEDAVRAAPDVKVWNLSLGVSTPCIGPEFSVFAQELDELARQHRILFVIAAGNYVTPLPLRVWPADAWHQDGRDIIGPPADSVLGLTVGSIAHAHGAQSAVKRDEPAAYSRRGPAPGLLPKPEVVHYGGNCSSNNGHDGHGIASLDAGGNPSRGWGTSYAAPLVASVAAHAWDQLVEAQHEVTPEMVRAVVIHSAALGSARRKPEELRYFGFGTPDALSRVLTCEDSAFTTWHRVYIPAGQFVEHEFPMPASLLQNGKFSGEIVVTLCYAPPLDPNSGEEYCRSNVNVKMGIVKPRRTLKPDRRTGKVRIVMQDGFRSEVPPDPRSQGEGFEAALIEHGFKWSPVKVYRKRFPRGIEGERWQLQFDVLYRAGEAPPDQPQEAFAIVTVKGLAQNQPVYRDGVRALRQQGHVARSVLSMRTRIRR